MPIRLLLLLTAAAIEAIPLALIATVLATWELNGSASAIDLPAWPLLVGVLLAYGLTYILQRRGTGQRLARVALAAGALAATLLYLYLSQAHIAASAMPRMATPLLISTLAAMLYAWSRGAVLAREELNFDAVYSSFRRGLAALFVALVLALGTPALAASGWSSVLLFFLAALCALSLARVDEERRRGTGAEGPPPVRGEWVLTLLVVTGGVGLAGVTVASIVSPAALGSALAPLGRVADLLQWLFTPLFWLLGHLIDPLVAWIRSLPRRRRHAPVQPNPQPAAHAQPPFMRLSPHQVLALGHTFLIVIALIAACLALWFAFAYRQRHDATADGDEERESLWSWALFLAGIRAVWQRLWNRLRGRTAAGPAAGITANDAVAAGSIRDIYRRLLVRAAHVGLPRRAAETPYEYLARLRGFLSRGEKEAALLTALYTQARYGPDAPSQYTTAAANDAWARLEPALRLQEGDVNSR